MIDRAPFDVRKRRTQVSDNELQHDVRSNGDFDFFFQKGRLWGGGAGSKQKIISDWKNRRQILNTNFAVEGRPADLPLTLDRTSVKTTNLHCTNAGVV